MEEAPPAGFPDYPLPHPIRIQALWEQESSQVCPLSMTPGTTLTYDSVSGDGFVSTS